MTEPTSRAPLPMRAAVRNALLAGAIAFVVRLLFALAAERMAMGAAIGTSALFFLGTTVLVFAGILIVVALRSRR